MLQNRWRLRTNNGPLTRYAKLWVAYTPGMPGTFSLPVTSKKPLVSDPGMHLCTCGMHVLWCMSASLTHGGRDKRSRHSQRMCNPQFRISGKRPMRTRHLISKANHSANLLLWTACLQIDFPSHPTPHPHPTHPKPHTHPNHPNPTPHSHPYPPTHHTPTPTPVTFPGVWFIYTNPEYHRQWWIFRGE